MDRSFLAVTLGLAVSLAACGEPAQEMSNEDTTSGSVEMTSSWSYVGETGPAMWGGLSDEYATCSTGVAQSPINLVPAQATTADLPALAMTYGAGELSIEDTGYGYKANPAGEHTLTVGGDTYRLLQFHAHTPSEHTLDGEFFPMEVHFVHQNEAGELAVVGVMIAEGEAHAGYADVVASIEGEMAPVAVDELADLLPSDLTYFTYPGSLTTPPCSEGVRWIVLEESITLSPEQLAVFREAHGETNRPTLPLNDREVRYSGE